MQRVTQNLSNGVATFLGRIKSTGLAAVTLRRRDEADIQWPMLAAIHEIMRLLIRDDRGALTQHQFAVLLTCYTTETEQTVRSLAKDLGITKSVVCRALNRLGELDLLRRKIDPRDRRSILVERTEAGHAFIAEMERAAEAK